jgi:hypothetical protein
MTLFVSKSQHFTILSSPHENKYGCRGEIANPRTVEICPVSVTFKLPDAKSHILIVLSPAPLANHLLSGSTASARTHPKCPEITRMSFQGACQSGRGCRYASFRTKLIDGGKSLLGVGPKAFGGAGPFPLTVSAFEVAACFAESPRTAMPSIILATFGFDARSASAAILVFFARFAIAVAAASWSLASR